MKKKICFAVGGTGGHIIPACVVATQVSHACELFFCGVGLSNHSDRLQQKNIPYYTLKGETPFRKNPIHFLKSIALLLLSTWQCWKIHRREKPDLIIGFGSFHSFPALLCAYLHKIPIILFESNVQIGRVNRFYSKWALLSAGVFTELHESFTGKFCQVALPIYRPFGISTHMAREYFQLNTNRLTLLITGGSLGARYINQMIIDILPKLHIMKLQIIHLAGKEENISYLHEKYRQYGIHAIVKSSETNMFFAWASADIAICRAGAATLSELIEFEVPAIVIPYPHSAANHQVSNGRYFSDIIGGGIAIEETKDSITIFQNVKILLENREKYRAAIILFKRKQFHIPFYQVILKHLQIPVTFYFLGIGGIGMSALAQILLQRGNIIYGSDQQKNTVTDRLQEKGAYISVQSNSPDIPIGSCIVYSSAIQKKYVESLVQQSSYFPIMHRSDLLDQLMKEKIPLLIAGTHGKTTTSAMLAHVLKETGLFPSYVIGGVPNVSDIHGYFGRGNYFVGEVDESDGSFLRTPAYGAIVTNVESDHIEYWKSEKKMQQGFDEFLAQVTKKDLLFLCADDPYLANSTISAIRYGFSTISDYQIGNFIQNGMKSYFSIFFHGKEISISLPLIGRHNASNATAVFGLCLSLGISESQIALALHSFRGVSRRCEYKGYSSAGGIVYDDYAHHPTEIVSTLKAIKQAFPDKRLIALFQPHRYSRLQLLLSEFATSLSIADYLIITDVYSAGENETLGISSADLISAIEKDKYSKCTYIERDQIVPRMQSILRDSDVLITMGAGDITEIGTELIYDK